MRKRQYKNGFLWPVNMCIIVKECLLLIAVSCFFSCSDDIDGMTDTCPMEEATDFKSPFDCVGELHNEAMDAMKKENIGAEEMGEFAMTYIDSNKEKVFNIESYASDAETKELLSKAQKIGRTYGITHMTRAINELNDSILNLVPANIRHYVQYIYNLLDYNYADTTQVNNVFNKFDYAIYSDNSINGTDKGMLLGISAIAKASTKYNFNTIQTRAVTAKTVAAADVTGAVEGAVSWKFWGKAATGLVFGPGGVVLSCTRELVLSAIVASGGSIIWGSL